MKRIPTFLLVITLGILNNFGERYYASAEPFTTILGVGSAFAISGLLAGHEYVKCRYYECCNEDWIPGNHTTLKAALEKRLYGQHLVVNTVVRSIRAHLNNEKPRKPLTLSFHGWTGGGKNYVSSIIAEHLYKLGLRSSHVHLFVSSLHFPHAKDVTTYKDNLQNWIKGNVTRCARSLFIFDELDKMEPGVMDAIKPLIDYHGTIRGVDYTKSIFIFLSNTGGNDITNAALEHWQNGGARTEIKLSDMEELIHLAAFNEKGGLRHSNLISSHLIDHFVPFLPLQREHVKECIRDQFRWKNLSDPTDEQLKRVADMLQFYPKGVGVFSTSGCKRIIQKVEILLEEEREESGTHWDDEL